MGARRREVGAAEHHGVLARVVKVRRIVALDAESGALHASAEKGVTTLSGQGVHRRALVLVARRAGDPPVEQGQMLGDVHGRRDAHRVGPRGLELMAAPALGRGPGSATRPGFESLEISVEYGGSRGGRSWAITGCKRGQAPHPGQQGSKSDARECESADPRVPEKGTQPARPHR